MASLVKTDKIVATAGGAQEFTLPTTDGTAKSAVITDGSGVLSFATGTPSATNTLRGDGTWGAAVGNNIVKGWINFDGTGTVAIGDSFNVSALTDLGTGNYRISWDTDFANVNYAVSGISTCTQCVVALGAQAVGSIDVYTMLSTNGTATDNANVCFMAVGDQ